MKYFYMSLLSLKFNQMKRKYQALVEKLLTELLIMMTSIIFTDFIGHFKRLLPRTSSVNVPPFF